ncbi:MAG: spore coat protein CotH [Myxococcota bacterium]|jgi:spore coat protein CotH
MIALFLALTACRPAEPSQTSPDTEPPAVADPVYDLGSLLRVELELPEADWQALQAQTRSFEETLMVEDCQEQPFDSPYTWFEGSARINGEDFERIDIRKKGFIGSLSTDKPGLKLDLGEYDDTTFHGERRLTLNNSISDPALIRQCLTYAAFNDAGLPASRCSLAQVTVNGEDLGIYVNVEPLKEPLIARHFERADGNLYEGTLSDFREGWTGTLEKKTNEDEDDWSDIEALVEAASADDGALLDELSAVLDLDQFFSFWAMEALTQHGDGYAGNTNNFYLYADPSDGRFRFLPWGVDMTLGVWEADEAGPGVVSVYANSTLTHRLYALPEGRQRYEDALRGLLSEAWDEDRIFERIDTMAALIEPELSEREWRRVSSELEDVRALVDARRAGLAGALPESAGELRESFCFTPSGAVEIAFETTWGTLSSEDMFSTGASTMYLDFGDGTVLDIDDGSAVIGIAEGGTVLYLPAWISETEAVLIYASLSSADITPGTVELDLSERLGALFYLDTETMTDFAFASYIVGELSFTEADTATGAAVAGSMTGQFFSF